VIFELRERLGPFDDVEVKMSRLDPKESFEALKQSVQDSIKKSFPQVGDKHILDLEEIEIPDKQSSADYTSQKKAKMGGRTWGVPVQATLVLKDAKTGKVIDRKKRKIATLPKVTNRYSYIVEGSEFQVDGQFRLRPGVFTKVKANGELDSFFNVKGRPLHVGFDPKARKFQVQIGGAKPSLYPIMKAMGVSDDTLERQWGKEILEANKLDSRGRPVKVAKTVIDFASRLDPKSEVSTYEEAAALIQENFSNTELHPEVTERTLGKPIDHINADAMLRSSGRLLGIARGEQKPDVRDSLMFKDLHGVEDFVAERITGHQKTISRRIGNNLDRRDRIDEIVGPDVFGRPVREFFGKVSLANTPSQTNPLKMISSQMKTTIAGEGGVADANRITEEAKLVDPSHFGVLDPLHTPEGNSTGVSLQLALGARKKGNRIVVPLLDAKTGKRRMVGATEMHDSVVALPDSVTRVGGKFVPKKGRTVLASTEGNEMRPVPMKEVKYVVPKSSQMFSISTNMVPFLDSNSPNRATMAGRHMEQAIPLVDSEPPLVQSMLGKKSFDEIVGKFSAHHTPVAGEVIDVNKDNIVVRESGRKKTTIPLYNNYPLNDKKGFIDSKPVVKKGDRIEEGQLVADTTFTRGGVYAPGRNLKVAYTPRAGLAFEDGIVISETAAQKLTSAHMYKKGLSTRDASLDGKKKYQAYYPDRLNKEQAAKLDDGGVVKVGQTVKSGDTLVAALADQQLTTEQQKLLLLHRSTVKPKKDKAVTWEEDFEGEVVEVNRQGGLVEVHVKTKEPMEVGDKLSTRSAAKGIVTGIVPDHEMPSDESGDRVEIIMNPIGIAGRLNVGQILETAASKVAEKRGEPYQVENFTNEDNRSMVEGLLREEGVKDKEDLEDPATGRKIPNVLTGKQYFFKLEHQVGKKMSARDRDSYDHNLIPRGGGKYGGQAMGTLGNYALLAHGAQHNLREMQTLKSDKGNDDLWGAIQAGEMLPPPKTTFANEKFNSYLKAMGVDTHKDGNSLQLVPITDKDVLSMSNGEIKDGGRLLKMRTLKPEKNGLFDEQVTGGVDGKKFAHIKLIQPMPNPLFEKAIMSLSGIRSPQFGRLIDGEDGVDREGNIVEGAGVEGAEYGPQAVGRLLNKIDVEKELKEEESRIEGLKGQAQNESRRRVRYLRNLSRLGMTATDAYMTKNVPVIPPSMRPISLMEDGSLQNDDLNELYKGLAIVNKKHGEFPSGTPESLKAPVAASVYDHMKALTGLGGTLNSKHPGILQVIAGKEGPKTGFVQGVLLKRKQDLTARSTIVPEPSLNLDEAMIPRKAAKEIYKPFIVRELRRMISATPGRAKKMVEADDPLAGRALERVVEERPLLLKRDPALHKYSVQAFKPKLTEGRAIKIHPMVTGGYGADFDGNCCAPSSKVVLKLSPKLGITDLNTLEEVLPVKFSGETRVIKRGDEDFTIETCISNFPRTEDPIAHDRSGNPIFGVPEGVQVLSYDHERSESIFCDVTGVTVEQDCPTVEVKGRRFSVIASDNESMCLYNHQTGGVEKASPVGAEGRLMPIVGHIPNADIGEFDFDFGWMIGAFVSDGFFSGGGESIIGYTKVSDEHREKFFHTLRRWERGKLRRVTHSETHGPEDSIPGRSTKDHIWGVEDQTELFASCYDPSRRSRKATERSCLFKRLPTGFSDLPTETLYGILSGLLDGDGHLSQDNVGRIVCQFHTSSVFLADSVQLLCHLLGIRTSRTTSPPKAGRPQKHDAYVITLSRVDIACKASLIELVGEGDELLRLLRADNAEGRRCKDDRDIVPVPASIMNLLASRLGPCDSKLQRYLAETKSRTRRGYYVTRRVARKMLPYLSRDLEEGETWSELVAAVDIRWDVIQKVTEHDTIEVFDLIVPETKVFAVNGGLVIWDTMSAYVPVSREAVKEARQMFPSKNLFSPATHRVMYTPSHEQQVGLFIATQTGKRTNKSFKDQAALEKAFNAKEVELTDVVNVGGTKTTLGRVRIDSVLPEKIQGGRVLKDLSFNLTKSEQGRMFQLMADVDPKAYPDSANKLKDIGNETVDSSGFSFGLDDLKVHRDVRDPALDRAAQQTRGLNLKDPKDVQKFVDIYGAAMERIEAGVKAKAAEGSRQIDKLQVAAGIKGNGYRQLTAAPVLFVDGSGKVVPNPVTKSFSEGLTSADYWSATSGGRKGIVQKVQSVSEPGYLTKMMTNSVIDTQVDTEDCGTDRGINLSVDEPDAVGRFTVADLNLGKGKKIPTGTMLTPEILTRVKNNKVGKVTVRSPMRCNHPKGVCARCVGLDENGKLPDKGTNVGVMAAQALGERGTQLALKSFHSGGVYEGKSEKNLAAGGLDRAVSLLYLKQKVKGSATLASGGGKIRRIKKDPAGGFRVKIGDQENYVPADRKMLSKIKPGASVKKGDALTSGPVNAHELLPLTSMSRVQGHLAGELHDIYGQYGVRRRNSEIMVRALSNVTKVDDPGDHPDLLPGDFASTSQVYDWNKKNKKAAPVAHAPVLRGVKQIPLDVQEDWMARLNHEHLRSTMIEASQQGWSTDLHGLNPIPPLIEGVEFGKGTEEKPWRY
jgi:DNA-directed RNA polymerase beta subunit